jgi:hypothetical protein
MTQIVASSISNSPLVGAISPQMAYKIKSICEHNFEDFTTNSLVVDEIELAKVCSTELDIPFSENVLNVVQEWANIHATKTGLYKVGRRTQ